MPKKIVIIGAAVLVLGAGIAVPVVMSRAPSKHAAKAKPKPVLEPMELDEFLVNLADTGEQHFLKCTVVLEVDKAAKGKEAGGGGEGEKAGVSPETARMRDTIITTMSRRRFSELLAADGKETLKSSIIHDVNKAFGKELVMEVYFTSFAMQ
jgi:flagellar protein FliL